MESIQSFIKNASSGSYSISEYLKSEELLSEKTPQTPAYTVETTSRVQRIALEIILGILSVLFFPYGIYRLVHILGGLEIVRAQWMPQCRMPRDKFIKRLQENAIEDPAKSLVLKRISISVDGRLIDAMIFGKRENLENKRWTLVSNGNSMSIEVGLTKGYEELLRQVNELGTNILLYNYQGVGGSEGWSTRDGIINAHKACVRFLEDETEGVGAEELIQWGISIGGGVQGLAMASHPPKKGIKHVLLKNQTFSEISKVPGHFLGGIIKMFGWEIGTNASSEMMEEKGIPEIILQTASNFTHVKAEDILDDGLISDASSYAKDLLQKKTKWMHKKFIGLKIGHCKHFNRHERKKIYACVKRALLPEYAGFHKTPLAGAK